MHVSVTKTSPRLEALRRQREQGILCFVVVAYVAVLGMFAAAAATPSDCTPGGLRDAWVDGCARHQSYEACQVNVLKVYPLPECGR